MACTVRTRSARLSITPNRTRTIGSVARGADVCCFRTYYSVPCAGAYTATVGFDRLTEHEFLSVSALSKSAKVTHEVHPKALIRRQQGQKGRYATRYSIQGHLGLGPYLA
jgi:hypothetical protein